MTVYHRQNRNVSDKKFRRQPGRDTAVRIFGYYWEWHEV